MILFNTRLQLAEEKKRHLLEQVSGNESNRLDVSKEEPVINDTRADHATSLGDTVM